MGQDELMTKGSASWNWPSAAKCLFLLSCVVFSASSTISFSWAASKREFSPFTPLIVQSLVLAPCTLIGLVWRYGREEVKLLVHRKYAWFAISGFLEGSMFCMHNLALTKMPATALIVLMQLQVFIVLFLQASLFRSPPTAVQILCVASMICLLFSYKLATSFDDSVGANDYSGIMPAFGAAFFSGACDLALECFSKRSMVMATNRNADLLRCLFYNEIFKIPVGFIMLFAFDTKFASAGLFYGWDYSVVLGGAGASTLALVFVNTAVVLHGALPTNLALSLEVALVYLLDVLVLRTGVFNIVRFLEMCCFAGMIAAYNLDVLTMLSWEAACGKASDSVRRVGQQLTTDFATSKAGDKLRESDLLIPR